MCDWKGYYARIRNPRPHLTKRNLWILLAVPMAIAFISTFLAYQQRIVDRLQPFARWMHDTPGGWLIPIGLMFVLSFPPLFGHEIIAILCGDVWGVWIGFGIVAAGTFFGELGNFYAFKWCCNARGKRYEQTKIKYALYAQVVREGGLKMPTIMRFTAIPGHLLTAVFSTCGMSVWMFGASAILSLPKQLAIVYIGVSNGNSGVGSNAKATGVKVAVVLVTGVMTVVAMRYINKKMDEVKHRVVYARRKARQMKALAAAEPFLLAVDLESPRSASDTMFSLSSAPAMDDKIAKERSADGPETSSQARTRGSEPIVISAVPQAAGRDGSREGRRKLRW
ncbi:hypothetical protein C8Q74DRAFT_677119 [Fomes fomentarius]|nr:hypothetical protein C8Q74DRAFT_677119 [Fomes fomentarius]